MYKDEMLPGLKNLTNVVHDSGSTIIARLHHGGRICSSEGIFDIKRLFRIYSSHPLGSDPGGSGQTVLPASFPLPLT